MKTHLEYHDKDNNSHKEYNVEIVKRYRNEYDVQFSYGRIRGTLSYGVKNPFLVSFLEAQKIAYELIESKKKKGYKEHSCDKHVILILEYDLGNYSDMEEIYGKLSNCAEDYEDDFYNRHIEIDDLEIVGVKIKEK